MNGFAEIQPQHPSLLSNEGVFFLLAFSEHVLHLSLEGIFKVQQTLQRPGLYDLPAKSLNQISAQGYLE